ncbi:hypothetical protein ERO13_A07G187000v2 [Gossypium hirsutum]|uniref:Pseudopaline exporter CntI isoform X2 n=1 Tax=Gossypium hirsutum TaxID=3635 RepID=A0A1U8P6X0_GOSHI|nr:pseudopaline exporter CntI isoform X2 [Gossypium hirsutum]KAG4192902.1 hypothetical protein ERO13_A07G187000v2 [Gossypium hirsutum]
MAASEDTITDDGNHTVELTVLDNEESAANGGSAAASSEEITPLLTQIERPKINIFSVSRSRRKPRELVIKAPETEISPVSQFMLWAWSGSRYSGLLCMALSSVIYFVMEILSENFTAQSIPLFETAFVRCTVTLILSYIWLRRIGLPIFGATHPRKLLLLRSLVGYLSLLSFIYCIQRIPFSLAILLSFTTPIMASIVARIILYEKLKITEIGGLACSFSGMLFIFQQMLTTQGTEKTEEASNSSFRGSNHIYAALIGFFSSITGGISYCLIKAAAKATDQPVVTVLSFAILASPAAGICTFAFEEFVLPSFNSLSLMLALGILSFLAEVFLAHGLHLEKINKAANVMFMEAALSQLWGIGTSSIAPSLGRLVGCILILISVSFTMFFGPEKENE